MYIKEKVVRDLDRQGVHLHLTAVHHVSGGWVLHVRSAGATCIAIVGSGGPRVFKSLDEISGFVWDCELGGFDVMVPLDYRIEARHRSLSPAVNN